MAVESALERLNEAMQASRRGDGGESIYRDVLAQKIERLALEGASRRRVAEDEWYSDAIQYKGVYDSGTQSVFRSNRNQHSEVFVNLTRARTRTLRARLADILLPTDMLNWSLRPSKVPDLPDWAIEEVREELAAAMEEEAAAAAEQQQAAPPEMAEPGMEAGMPEPGMEAPVEPTPMEEVPGAGMGLDAGMMPEPAPELPEPSEDRVYNAVYAKASEIASRMELSMADDLQASDFPGVMYQVVHEACKYGTGVLKGPVADWHTKMRWVSDEQGWGVRSETSLRPTFHPVHLWDFFPDPEASDMKGAEYVLELHRWSRSDLRMMGPQMQFDPDAVRHLLRMGPTVGGVYSNFIRAVQEFERGDSARGYDRRFYVWEYRGPIELDDLEKASGEMGVKGEQLLEGFRGDDGELDPLASLRMTVYVCQGVMLAMSLNPLDSQELPYHVFSLDPEESSMFGDGVPAMVRDSQAALNSAWRITLDNAGLAGIPAFLMHEGLQSEDSRPGIAPGKVYRFDNQVMTSLQGVSPLLPIPVAGNSQQLLEVIEYALRFMDEESSLPLIAQGEPSASATSTAHGMTLLANAVNIGFRNIVRAFDFSVTLPAMRQLYHWKMQFSDDERLKGDLEVVPLASSVLLVREVQASQRMMLVQMAGQNPEIRAAVNMPSLIRRMIEAMQIPVSEVMVSDEEYEAELARMRALEEMTAQAASAEPSKVEVEQVRQQGVMAVEELRRSTEMERLAMQREIAQLKANAQLEGQRMKASSEERRTAVETYLRKTTGQGV